MQQLVQVIVDNISLCEIYLNTEINKFETVWNTSNSDVMKYRIDYDPRKSIITWIHAIEKHVNCEFSNINVKEIYNYGASIAKIRDYEWFLGNRTMYDLVPHPSEIVVYQFDITT
jgi:hypothetical protein